MCVCVRIVTWLPINSYVTTEVSKSCFVCDNFLEMLVSIFLCQQVLARGMTLKPFTICDFKILAILLVVKCVLSEATGHLDDRIG